MAMKRSDLTDENLRALGDKVALIDDGTLTVEEALSTLITEDGEVSKFQLQLRQIRQWMQSKYEDGGTVDTLDRDKVVMSVLTQLAINMEMDRDRLLEYLTEE